MQWMGLSNDQSDPNFVPPTDADVGPCTSRIQLTHSLETAWFQPL
jgi:hypothetical protein